MFRPLDCCTAHCQAVAIGTYYSAYNTPRSNVAVILVTVPCIPYVPALAFPLALLSLPIS